MTTAPVATTGQGAGAEPRTADELRELAKVAGPELELAPARIIIAWAVETVVERLCITSSMSYGVLAHLAASISPGIDVVFLDTGYHFAETIGTADAISATIPVNLVTVRPELSVAEQDEAHGKDLWATDPDRCCAMRKVAPLKRSLEGYDAWATGLRRDETRNRVIAPVVGWDDQKQKVKVSPLARWTQDDVDAYVAENDILVNPLLYDGYPSIGCWPCTRRVQPGDDPRSGRWAGLAKTECGIH
jgi:phosphoadenosine phosphosulfate reductase